jgi:NAD(P)H-hydrate epimerase
MKILSCEQIKEVDSATISNEPIASADLMERAAGQLFRWISDRYGIAEHFIVFAGPGNNGGDGLALARMLGVNGYRVDVHLVNFSDKISVDCALNLKRLENVTNVTIYDLAQVEKFPVITSGDILIDALFGSGLKRPVEGFASEIIKLINNCDSKIISVDLPSGLFGENNALNKPDSIIKAEYTLTFELPKLSFMFPENALFTGKWVVLPIGLDENAIRNAASPYNYLLNSNILQLLKIRNKFDHKGTFGHGLLVAGSAGKMGAAVLGASAALRTGIGLITCHIPSGGNLILQSAIPEAMAVNDKSENCVSEIGSTDNYSAVGIGPGLGTNKEATNALKELLSVCRKPLVIDADALNILSFDKSLLELLPPDTILTPHPKEFERIAGKSTDGFSRLKRQVEFSFRYKCIIIYKGANSTITTPAGEIYFNSTGNPGMAKGGSGDVLTGIVLSLLSQGYSPLNASLAGVFIHGLAGDIAAGESSYESIIASDIINCIGKAFNEIRRNGKL